MFRNYFKTTLRHLAKNKLYATINILGLTAGLTACLLISVYIIHELSYDKFNKNADRIVRVTMEYGQSGTVNTVATTGTKVGPEFTRRFPAIEAYVRTYVGHNIVAYDNKVFDEQRILFADPAFFNVFSFALIEGSKMSALDAPDKMVISKSMAQKYFGTSHVVNKTIRCGEKDYRISGVFQDVPDNSQLKFDFATQFMNIGNNVKEESWWTANWITYLLLKDKNDIGPIQQQVEGYMKSASVRTEAGLEGQDYLTYHLEPLTSVHLYSPLEGFEPNGSIRYIYMFGVIALLILVIGGANYTNLATAQATGRSGEIGMRKVMGATRGQVFMQFIAETSFITFVAAGLALFLSIILLPYFNNITGIRIGANMLIQPLPLTGLALFSLLASLLAGFYPAIILSGNSAIGVIRQGFTFTGGSGYIRKVLIVLQFAISVFLIIYTGIILQQLNYIKNKDLGYDKDHIIVLPIGRGMLANFDNLKSAFAHVPGVEAITASYETPEFVNWGDGITAIDEKGKHDVSLNAMPVDLDFTRTLNMQLVAGRDFQQSDFSLMDTSGNYANYKQPYIINETLAKTIGWTPAQAIGKTISKGADGPVVGVVKDFNFSSLHNPIGPMIIFLGRDYSRNFLMRVNGNDIHGTLERLQAVWSERVPERPFSYHFLDDDYNKLYLAEQRSSQLFSVAASFAIFLACMGLFGLAAYTTLQRTKEIGIRRVMGAGISSISMLMTKGFLKLVGIAILIAIPAAWWAGNAWLEDFAFRISEPVFVFVAASLITIVITIGTVGYHSIRAAITNPVKTLRSD